MEVIDNRALIVRTKYPERITAAIEKSKVVGQEDGVYEVAVKWGLNEAQLLNQFIKAFHLLYQRSTIGRGSSNPSIIKRLQQSS